MESKPITAEAFFNTHWNAGKTIEEIIVLFAKYQRKQMIEAVKKISGEWEYMDLGVGDIRAITDSIENAYKEDKIV